MNTLTPELEQAIKKLYLQDKLTQMEISRRLKIPQPTIRKWLVEMGVNLRRGWAKTTRVCRRCEKELPISEFYIKDYVCKKCKSAFNRSKGHELKRQYNITRAEYLALLNSQGGRCAICGKPPEENGRELAVDHDHKTGKVRGLLCTDCNTGMGMLCDSVDILQKAIKYLSS